MSTPKVTIFQDANYQGKSQELEKGLYNLEKGSSDIELLTFGDNQVSSLKIPMGFKVTIYEHPDRGGRSKVFTGDTAYVGSDFDNVTSTIEIELIPFTSFHGHQDASPIPKVETQPTILGKDQKYRFYPHFHPCADRLVKALIEGSVSRLQACDTKLKSDVNSAEKPELKDYELYEEFFESYGYSNLVASPYPVKNLDFSLEEGAYAVYNWELFYHVPLTIAIHLSKNQRFQEAQQWFHYIFDPTDDGNGPTPERFWKVQPFQTNQVELITNSLTNLSTGIDPELRDSTINAIDAWRKDPFRPHVVARYRPTAYQLKTVMAYLDNLIAWGDNLFREDSRESINEATQIYILAANLLGPRPQKVPQRGTVQPQSYASLKDKWNEFGNALVDLEDAIAFDNTPHSGMTADTAQASTVGSLGKTHYFCIPQNEKLLSYWDTVGDRLFKIRNSLNIQGMFRQLPLFAPPIDPALLARAAAAGIDTSEVISGLNQPLPLVRFQILIQKATEICQEVKSLGNNLLSAMEKEDNEALAILRAKHERVILSLVETTKYAQWQEATKNREGLEKSLANAIQRYVYYERLFGKQESDIDIPDLDELDTESLRKMRFKSSESEVKLRANNLFKTLLSGQLPALPIPQLNGIPINLWEIVELVLLDDANKVQIASSLSDLAASFISSLPQFDYSSRPQGTGVGAQYGSIQVANIFSTVASSYRTASGLLTHMGNTVGKVGSYVRRAQEWELQSNLAAGEITQIFKQLRAAQIREAIAEWEWNNHKQQMKHAEEIEQFLTDEKNGKKTNQAFYSWMKREVKGLYGQVFQFAFDIAKKAERALQHELGNADLSFLQMGYLSGKEGLLAGEKLYLDLKRMEMAYHDLNQREYELTKHVSLLQVNPVALLQLRTTGRCTVTLPEELFDMDCPSHYFRRIKSVALTIPCVTGPYTSINCTLTLQKSSIRKTTNLLGGYPRTESDDDRFSDYFGSLQSIVTSSAQNDSGMFEPNLRDERYLPFEGSGIISTWQLQLPNNPTSKEELCQFDYNTISDVILHLRYTAREGGVSLRQGAIDNIATKIQEANTSGLARLFSLKHEFPAEWHRFVTSTGDFKATIKKSYFPFFAQGKSIHIDRVQLFTISVNDLNSKDLNLSVISSKEDQFELSIPKSGVEKEAQVFVILHYSVQ